MTSLLGRLGRPGVAIAWLAVLLIASAGWLGLMEPTETRYAEIAREMHAGGDWLIPRLDGLPHFHKPPLAYWAAAAAFACFGPSGWAARLPAALAALLTLVFTVRIARREGAALGLSPGLAVWVLGSSLMFMTIGRALAADPFLAAAVTGFWAFSPSPLALALLGAGFLAKGPVVLVTTLLPLVAAAAWERRREPLARLGPLRGWALFAVVALPWYVTVAARTPGLLDYFLRNQLWERYATTVHHRAGPPWTFVAVLAAGALPWTPALIAGIARAIRSRSRPEARLLLCWLGVPLIFFSFSGSKLPSYLLPCLPAAALLTALGLEGRAAMARIATSLLLTGAIVAGYVFGPSVLERLAVLPPPAAIPLPLAASVAFGLLAVASAFLLRGRPAAAAMVLTAAWTALLVTALPYESALGSPRRLAALLAENRGGGEPVVEVARFNAGLPFYLGEPVRLLDVPRETGFGDRAGRREVILDADSLAALAARHPRVWLLGPRDRSEALALGVGLRYETVARWRRDALGFVTR